MKSLFFIPVLLLALVLISGCNDGAGTDLDDAITLSADDAADAFASSLGGGTTTSGLTTQLEELATAAGGGGIGKVDASSGVMFDTTITRQRLGTYSFTYTFRYSYGLANANQFNFAYSMKGVYDTPRMSSNDSAWATLQASNLLSGQAYSITGVYNRYGTQTSKVRNKVHFSSTITFAFSALQIDKATKKITSGTATLSMSGQTSTGNIFAYTATITFLGNQQATLVIDRRTYTLNLTLGEATPA